MNHEEMRHEIAALRAQTAGIRAQAQEARAQRAAERARHAAADTELARLRREGRHGRDWQVVQQRVDLRQTTIDDVLGGVDTSPEARAVREAIHRDVAPRVRAQAAEAADSEALAADLVALREAQRSMVEALETMRLR